MYRIIWSSVMLHGVAPFCNTSCLGCHSRTAPPPEQCCHPPVTYRQEDTDDVFMDADTFLQVGKGDVLSALAHPRMSWGGCSQTLNLNPLILGGAVTLLTSVRLLCCGHVAKGRFK